MLDTKRLLDDGRRYDSFDEVRPRCLDPLLFRTTVCDREARLVIKGVLPAWCDMKPPPLCLLGGKILDARWRKFPGKKRLLKMRLPHKL